MNSRIRGLATGSLLFLAVVGQGETPPPGAPPGPAIYMMPPPPPVGIQVFDNSVFDGVGRPSKLEQAGTGEYTSTDYQKWLRLCESKKDVSMQAYRDCVASERTRSANALQDRRQGVEQRSLSSRPPSPLDEPARALEGSDRERE